MGLLLQKQYAGLRACIRLKGDLWQVNAGNDARPLEYPATNKSQPRVGQDTIGQDNRQPSAWLQELQTTFDKQLFWRHRGAARPVFHLECGQLKLCQNMRVINGNL